MSLRNQMPPDFFQTLSCGNHTSYPWRLSCDSALHSSIGLASTTYHDRTSLLFIITDLYLDVDVTLPFKLISIKRRSLTEESSHRHYDVSDVRDLLYSARSGRQLS